MSETQAPSAGRARPSARCRVPSVAGVTSTRVASSEESLELPPQSGTSHLAIGTWHLASCLRAGTSFRAAFIAAVGCLLALGSPLGAAPVPPNKELKEIAPPVALDFWETMDRTDWLLLAGAGVLLVLACIAGWYFFLRKEPPPPPLPPDPRDVARERLEALRRRIGQLGPREFGAEVSDVLRHYIRARYGISTMRRTSEEFLNAVMKDRAFNPRELDLLERFLRQCDLLKFARADAGELEAERLVDEARNFVEGTAPPIIRPEPLPALPES